MTTIYLGGDYGDAVVVDGVAYHRNATNPVCHALTASLAAGDIVNIASQVMDYYTGSTDSNMRAWMAGHTPWIACEMAVSQLAANSDEVAVPLATWTTIYTAPAAGELRFYFDNAGSNTSFKVEVNGVEISAGGSTVYSDDFDTIKESLPLVVGSGDVVKVYAASSAQTVLVRFLPNSYP